MNRVLGAILSAFTVAAVSAAEFQAGTAKIDITPDYPIRLSGFAVRKSESEGVRQRIFAKALAVSSGPNTAALFITLDNCGIPREAWSELTQTIQRRHSIPAKRVVIFSSHTHSAPCLSNQIGNLFVAPLPEEQQAKVNRYTRELIDKTLRAADDALAHFEPVRIFFAQGRVAFAKNRRTPGGPVDHELPVLAFLGADGKPRAVLANYACHCTTLLGDSNHIHGDWAGVAAELIEKRNPGATALISIGCGADSNPSPRGLLEHVNAHGAELAREVRALLDGPMLELTNSPAFHARDFNLPFEALPTRQEWEKRAAEPGIIGYHARRNLEKLERGETLPTVLPYRVQAWNFGDQLAMIFLPGEVVVDYSLRLKTLFDADRLWVSGYANWVPCYIPSTRILNEGGYEAESSLWYYDLPARLSTNTENLIISAARELVPETLRAAGKSSEFPAPKSPLRSLASIRTLPEMKVELAAAEPLVLDPVAIDWGADGRLWVVEMRDFPQGMDGHWKPGGRVKILEDSDHDQVFDRATVFLDEIPFPTGITCWNDGALICAAPDILFARDTDHDGKADQVQKLFSGFATDNYQARVNSLALGLDGWFHGANGLIGGTISGGALKAAVSLGNRDFRFRPDTGEFETAAGYTQQGRARDDFDHWFGCDNSTLIWHFPLPERYLRRNPRFAPEATRAPIAGGADPNQLFPISQTLERFNDPHHANRTTAACGLGIYRDDLLGKEFYGNAFVCEPVHNLVRRMRLEPRGASFQAIKEPAESREFLASHDNWFRPVQVRAGPDGALWIVDMYRLVVEHPRWITPERLKTLDTRAGDDKGRLYRVYPRRAALRSVPPLDRLDAPSVARRIESPNGTERDRVQLELTHRKDQAARPVLTDIASSDASPAPRVQALSALSALDGLTPGLVQSALRSGHEAVRAFALTLAERFPSDRGVRRSIYSLAADPSPIVRQQLAFTLGQFPGNRSTEILAALLPGAGNDPWIHAAVLSSAAGRALEIAGLLRGKSPALIPVLLESDASLENSPRVTERMAELLGECEADLESWQLRTLERIARLNSSPDLASNPRLRPFFDAARAIAAKGDSSGEKRIAAVRVLRHTPGLDPQSSDVLLSILLAGGELELLTEAAETLFVHGKSADLRGQWERFSPSSRRATIGAAFRRSDVLADWLAHLEKTGSLGELALAQRQQLLRHRDPAIRARAERLFPPAVSSGRLQEAYARIEPRSASPARGSELFATHCAMCHQFAGQGYAVGPNLAALTDRSTSYLLTAILEPNAAVENRYLSYTIETRDGRSLFGIVAEETASSLVIANAYGQKETIVRSEVARVQPSNLSLMPEGFTLPPADMADLIAFLQASPRKD